MVGSRARCGSFVFAKLIRKRRLPAGKQRFEPSPDGVGGWRTARKEVVDLHSLMRGIDAVQEQREILVIRDHAPAFQRDPMEIDGFQAFPQADRVAHRRHPAVDRACADRYQDPTMLPEFPELLDVVLVRTAALDETEIYRPIEG